MQRAMLQYFLPQNHRLVVKGLKMAGRTDLIGTGPDCLVPPLPEEKTGGRPGPARKPAPRAAGKTARRPAGNKKNRKG